MAVVNYPSSILPLALVVGYTYQETLRLLRTSIDNGYGVVRKRFTNVPVNFTVQFLMSQDQLNYFQSWFASQLSYGVAWFNMDLAIGESMTTTLECRFLANPTYSLQGNKWTISAQIEASELPTDLTTDDVLEGLIDGFEGFEEASTYFDKIDTTINVDYPMILP